MKSYEGKYRIWLLFLAIIVSTVTAQALPRELLTLQKAKELTLASPDTSLMIISEIRRRGLAPEWEIKKTEGTYYYYSRHYRRVEKILRQALEADEVQRDNYLRLLLKRRLMKTYDVLHDDRNLTYSIDNVRKDAKRSNLPVFSAIADFTQGKCMHYHDMLREGYDRCLKAMEEIEKTDYRYKTMELFRCYMELTKMYLNDERYEEALEMSLKQESEAEKLNVDIRGLREKALRDTYAQRASLFSEMGRQHDADATYAQWQKVDYSNAIDDKEIIPYLIKSHHYKEALTIIRRYEQFLEEEGDSITDWMLRMRINEGIVTSHMNDFSSTAENFLKLDQIADSLLENNSRSSMEQSYLNIQDQDELKHRHWLLIVAAIIIVAVIIVAIVVLYFNRKMRQRNRTLQHMLNGLTAYRHAAIVHEQQSEDKTTKKAKTTMETKKKTMTEEERLFFNMDRRVTKEQLFLNPNLSRDDLAHVMGVGRNRFISIMSRYCDEANVTQYVNLKRVEFAVELMEQHPNYTLAAIMEGCGMTNASTFNRAFKHFFGVTPSEYRRQIA